VVDQVRLRGLPPALRVDERAEARVVTDLLFRHVEDVGDVDLDEVRIGVLVDLVGERPDARGLARPLGPVDEEVHRLLDGAPEVLACLRLGMSSSAGA